MAYNLMVNGLDSGPLCFVKDEPMTVANIKEDVLKRMEKSAHLARSSDFKIYFQGVCLEETDLVQPGDGACIVSVEAAGGLLGGKGGFGALIRAMGKSVENSRNKDACRDLSGRRVRDVETEKKLTEWVKKEAKNGQKSGDEKIKKLEGKLERPKHMFCDPEYMEQIRTTSETMDESLQQGLQAAGPSNGSQMRKRTAQSGQPSSSKSKKPLVLFGMEETSDLSDDEEDPAVKEVGMTTTSTDSQGSSPHCRPTQGIGDNVSPNECEPTNPETSPSQSIATLRPCLAEKSGSEELPMKSSEPTTSEPTTSPNSSIPRLNSQEATASNLSDPIVDTSSSLSNSQTVSGCELSEAKSKPESEKEMPSIEPKDTQSSTITSQSSADSSTTTTTTSSSSPSTTEPAPVSVDPSTTELAPVSVDPSTTELAPVSVDEFNSVEALAGVGSDVLKVTLQSLGCKCGGTLRQRAERLFSTQGKTREDWNPAILAKPTKKK